MKIPKERKVRKLYSIKRASYQTCWASNKIVVCRKKIGVWLLAKVKILVCLMIIHLNKNLRILHSIRKTRQCIKKHKNKKKLKTVLILQRGPWLCQRRNMMIWNNYHTTVVRKTITTSSSRVQNLEKRKWTICQFLHKPNLHKFQALVLELLIR